MKKPLVIFGAGDIAQLAHFYFSTDTSYEVAGFVVDAAYLSAENFCGLPLVAFESVQQRFPPESHAAFVALSYAKLNQVRAEKFLALKALGYHCATYLSSKATLLGDRAVGENCFILEDNTIQPFVRIGDNVTLWSGNHIGHHSEIGNHCFIASHVVISGGVKIEPSCFIGVNATLRDHITVGERCVVGAGALLLADAPANGVYVGNATERSRVPSNRLRRI